jgi:hypothetical protein
MEGAAIIKLADLSSLLETQVNVNYAKSLKIQSRPLQIIRIRKCKNFIYQSRDKLIRDCF